MNNSDTLQQQVQQAITDGTPLNICGGNSKTFIGRSPVGKPLDVSSHCGIINYDPRELVITARAGTLMSEIEATLAESGQMLSFEPPHFGATATLGGTIACGLSGSRRPFSGSARDFTLGCKILNGRGEILNFGGQVMKNVAGYDLSR
ncbi:MAG: FAD-binding protein, partial [Gallionella sp.]